MPWSNRLIQTVKRQTLLESFCRWKQTPVIQRSQLCCDLSPFLRNFQILVFKNALCFFSQELPHLIYPELTRDLVLLGRAPFDVAIHFTEQRGRKGVVETAGHRIYIKDFKWSVLVGVDFIEDFVGQTAVNKLRCALREDVNVICQEWWRRTIKHSKHFILGHQQGKSVQGLHKRFLFLAVFQKQNNRLDIFKGCLLYGTRKVS